MKNIPNKNTGDQYTSDDFNKGINEELKNYITQAGLTLTSADQTQIKKATDKYIADSLANRNKDIFYTVDGSSTVNNIVLNQPSGFPPAILPSIGDRITFKNDSTNRNGSGLTIQFIGLPNQFQLKSSDGQNTSFGEIPILTLVSAIFDGTNFILEKPLEPYAFSATISGTLNQTLQVLPFSNAIVNTRSLINGAIITPTINGVYEVSGFIEVGNPNKDLNIEIQTNVPTQTVIASNRYRGDSYTAANFNWEIISTEATEFSIKANFDGTVGITKGRLFVAMVRPL